MVSDPRSVTTPLPKRRRARAKEDKQVRRRAIIDAAREAFHEGPYESITMAAVAGRAGLAKGTLYLYFATKEELFLDLTLAEIGQWLDHLDKSLDRGLKGRNVGDLMGRTLRPRQDLLRLLSILHAVLERNVGDATVLAFKRSVLARVVATGARLERALPFLRSGEGVRILIRIYALVVGMSQVAVPGPVVARVLADPSVRAMRIDFFGALAEMLDALFAGLAFQRRHG